MSKKQRVTIDLKKGQYDRLINLQALMDASSIAEVVRQAIKLLDKVEAERSKGATFVIRYDDPNKPDREIEFL